MRKYTKYRKAKIEWVRAYDIKRKVIKLVRDLEIDWVRKDRITCFRSKNAKTRAYARIWGFSKIWQMALKLEPAYIIEIISEKFDKLTEIEKDKVLLHELTHIPKNFSGSLVPHIRRGKRNFHGKVEILISRYLRNLRNTDI